MAASAGRVADDWEMTPGLASALGLGAPGDSDDAPEGAARVQRKAVSMPPWASGQVQARGDLHGENTVAIAERGVASASSSLPHLDAIQRSFGSHDVSDVRAQIGGEAADASRAIGAEAYATGNRVAFSENPDLHTAAHEAAHVVQQRAGVRLRGDVGEVGDPYERNADAVADRVVQGLPAHDLLPDPGSKLSGEVLQRQAGQSLVPPASTTSQPESQMSEDRILQSPDPEISNKPVSVVGPDLRTRTTRYRDIVPKFKEMSEESKQQEIDWYNKLGLVGEFIDLFNSAPKTDPKRWDELPAKWAMAKANLDAAILIPIDPSTINEAGDKSNKAIDSFNVVFLLDSKSRGEFSGYLHGFTHAAENVQTVAVVVRDISFAAAVAIAVVAAAPAVAGAVGAGVATTGATGATASALTYGGTALAMGGLGAGIEGGGQAIGTLAGQGVLFLDDLLVVGKSASESVARFDWDTIGSEGWQGVKRGFIDGVLSFIAMGFDKVLAKGTSVAISRVLGQEGASTLAKILRMALTRAISGGASGAVIGALDGGIKAAIDGKSFAEVEAAMESGFKVGGLTGAVLGGVGGAFEGRTKARLTAEIAELQELLVKDPEEFARRYQVLVDSLTPQQRAAWETEMQGRRFVDRQHYEPAAQSYRAGTSSTPPEHQYGELQFKDWQEAAAMLDNHAKTGKPLTQAEVEAAHEVAGRHLDGPSGQPRDANSPGPLIGAGGRGVYGMATALSPEQIAVLETNPHIKLMMRGMSDATLTAEEVARRYETAVISYPDGATVQGKLDAFFAWYNEASRTRHPTDLAAAAQRELVSIHPFLDGNGRITRLVMDHALQSKKLPPALLENPGLDYMVSEAAWSAEVRRGIVESFQLTLRHVDLFNAMLRSGELARAGTVWGTILGLTSDRDSMIRWLYNDDPVCR